MPRAWVWLQLVIGWLPIWALFTTLIVTAHPDVAPLDAVLIGLRMIVAAAMLGVLVRRLVQRVPWPHPFRASFLLLHLVAAAVYSVTWILLNSAIESALRGALVLVVGYGIGAFLVLGVWLYVMVAGVTYSTMATQRAANAEAAAARSQLAALRSQLHPHFLFNTLHTVVQLIPREPERAAQAAEQLAGLLRSTIEQDRDVVMLAEERAFVRKYLDVERLRFGDRLSVHFAVTEEADAAELPSFALLTLAENAVRHGVEPRIEPTEVSIAARVVNDVLVLNVRDTGGGASDAAVLGGPGTGLRRLRERLTALYGGIANLEISSPSAGGFSATLTVPQVTT